MAHAFRGVFVSVTLACALFCASPAAAQPNFSVVASFGPNDPYDAWGRLVQTPDGSLYGTTQQGGASDLGTIYRVDRQGTVTIVHSFDGTDGQYPIAGLTLGADGALYGVTQQGGTPPPGQSSPVGTVFRLTLSGDFSTLHTFTISALDGVGPNGVLVQAADGAFYGAAPNGNTIFRIFPNGDFSVVHRFGSLAEGGCPSRALTLGSDGNLYGATECDMSDGTSGTIFRMDLAGDVTVLHKFAGYSDTCSCYPEGHGPVLLTEIEPGVFLGPTNAGLHSTGNIVRITADGQFAVVHDFAALDSSLGYQPEGNAPVYGGLIQGPDAAFYGTTAFGGSGNAGTVFRFVPGDGSLTVVHNFTSADGTEPLSGLTVTQQGDLLGVTDKGGPSGRGVVFRIGVPYVLPASGNITVTVPGFSDPWLAGMPAGSRASGSPQAGVPSQDFAPAQSPVLITGAGIASGNTLTVAATGAVAHDPSLPLAAPDGSTTEPPTSHDAGAENGISNITAPFDALLGLFLDNTEPDLTSPPQPAIDASHPALKQVFLIGSTSKVTVPSGATRLFLGTMDSSQWANNIGSFSVTLGVLPPCTPPQIIVSPVSQNVTRGQSATLSVQASGTSPLTYQWYRGNSGDTSNPVTLGTGSTFDTGPLTAGTSFWVRVTGNCGSVDSATAAITVSVPTTGSIHGALGIVDATKWPLDRAAVKLAIWAIDLTHSRVLGPFSSQSATYNISGLAPGSYSLVVVGTVDYIDNVLTDNTDFCKAFTVGCAATALHKESVVVLQSTADVVTAGATTQLNVNVPPAIVMIHGLGLPPILGGGGCYTKWYSPTDSSFWDNTARASGFISITPNYHFYTNGDWRQAVDEVQLDVQANLMSLTSGVSSWGLPPWVIIAHSEGGLVARALLNLWSGTNVVTSLRRLYMLGTPNSGVPDAVAAALCEADLGSEQMLTRFNSQFPTFLPLTSPNVFAFAGTKVPLTVPNDAVVDETSVAFIVEAACDTCQVRVDSVVQNLFPVSYYHWDLGSPASRTILTTQILPAVRGLR